MKLWTTPKTLVQQEKNANFERNFLVERKGKNDNLFHMRKTGSKPVYKCGKPYRFFTVRISSFTSLSKEVSVASRFSTVSMELRMVV